MTRSLGIVIPAYEPDINALTAYLTAIRDVLDPAVIRVEIDCPQEIHLAALESIVDECNAVTDKRGKGGAITDGFEALETELLAFVDADGSVPATSLVDVVRPVQLGAADLSVGSRRHPTSQIVSHQTVLRRLLGDIFAASARQLLPTRCRDYQCGAKAIRTPVWNDLRHYCYERGFAWDLEVVSVAGALGYEITEVPVVWEDHPQSTVDPLSTAVELATALVDVRRRTNRLSPHRLGAHRMTARSPTETPTSSHSSTERQPIDRSPTANQTATHSSADGLPVDHSMPTRFNDDN